MFRNRGSGTQVPDSTYWNENCTDFFMRILVIIIYGTVSHVYILIPFPWSFLVFKNLLTPL